MHIAIAKASPLTNVKPLPDALINQLSRKYMYMPDIELRLRSLQVIPRGKNIGAMSKTVPHDNAVAFAQENDLELFVGYLITPDPIQGGLQLVTHSFCVKNGEVIEPTAGIVWYPTVRYIGYKVQPSTYKNFLYLNRFNRLFI